MDPREKSHSSVLSSSALSLICADNSRARSACATLPIGRIGPFQLSDPGECRPPHQSRRAARDVSRFAMSWSWRSTLTLSPASDELMALLTQFFILSPYSFLINDAILLASIQDGTYDPVVVSLMIIYVLSRDPSLVEPPLSPPQTLFGAHLSREDESRFPSFLYSSEPDPDTHDPSTASISPDASTSRPSPAPQHFVNPSLLSGPPPPLSSFQESSTRAAVEPYLTFVEQTLFSRPAESGATSIATLQALLLLGTHYFQTLKCRAAWALICTGLVTSRENLGRRRNDRVEKELLNNFKYSSAGAGGDMVDDVDDKVLVEDEQSVNLWWMLGELTLFSFSSPSQTFLSWTGILMGRL